MGARQAGLQVTIGERSKYMSILSIVAIDSLDKVRHLHVSNGELQTLSTTHGGRIELEQRSGLSRHLSGLLM